MKEARDQFENQWQSAFAEAEVTSPGHLWSSIDATLAGQREAGYKKKILFFKWVAAASIFIAVTSGMLVWFGNINETEILAESSLRDVLSNEGVEGKNEVAPTAAGKLYPENKIASGTTIEKKDEKMVSTMGTDALIASVEEENVSDKEGRSFVGAANSHGSESSTGLSNESDVSKNTTRAIADNTTGSTNLKRIDDASYIVMLDDNSETGNEVADGALMVNDNGHGFVFILEKVDNMTFADGETGMAPWETDFLYLVPDLTAGTHKKAFEGFNLWAGLSIGSGSFNPGSDGNLDLGVSEDALNFSSGDGDRGVEAYFTDQSPIPSDIGSSFSAGLDFGTKVSAKVILSGGLHYMNLSSVSSSNLVVTDPTSNESLALFSQDISNPTIQNAVRSGDLIVNRTNVDFVNSFNYLTIPIKAGYVLVDKKLNLTLNSGISSNFLISNDIKSDDSTIGLFDESSSTDAYRPVYFNLLTSIELGYRFKEKYYFSLEPNYRRAINTITKDESTSSSKPTSIGVSVGIRYIF